MARHPLEADHMDQPSHVNVKYRFRLQLYGAALCVQLNTTHALPQSRLPTVRMRMRNSSATFPKRLCVCFRVRTRLINVFYAKHATRNVIG